MNATALMNTLAENRPFRPLEFEFTGGHKEIVRHPDNIMAFGTFVIIAQFEHDQAVPERYKQYSLLHLVSVQPAKAEAN